MGVWETNAKRLMVRFDGGGMDIYELPVRNGVLHGTDLLGWWLQITSKAALASR